MKTVPLNEGQFDVQTLRSLERAMTACWKEAHAMIRNRNLAGIDIPAPSKIQGVLEKQKSSEVQGRPLTAPEVAKILGISESSVRRISRKLLPFKQPRKTKSGKGMRHRRYFYADVLRYLKMFEVSSGERLELPLKASKRLKSRPPEIEI